MIVVDSAIWDAGQNEKDENHNLARNILQDIESGTHGELMVTDYIIDEVLTWVNEKVDHSTATKMSDQFFEDPEIQIIKINWAIIHRALELFTKRDYLSFTDATTAVVMDAHDIRKIATFDSDFENLDFEVIGI